MESHLSIAELEASVAKIEQHILVCLPIYAVNLNVHIM